MKRHAIIVLSGGQDSTLCLFLARSRGLVLHAITFDYSQKHFIEISAARRVAALAGVASHEVIHIPKGMMLSTSPLVDPSKQLELYKSMQQMEQQVGNRVENTFVPMRNTLFLTIAANRAIARNARMIYTGICQADNANYPDCTEKFKWKVEEAINQSLGLDGPDNTIHIVAPLLHMDKCQSVRLAHTMPDCWRALRYTHTSYDGLYPPIGMNHSNILRAAGFEQAGLPDPLVLRANREGLMELPKTPNYSDEVLAKEMPYLFGE